jgi:hypothetical protein
MTAWALSFGWNWLLVPVAIWFVNGLRKAALNPRIRLHSFTRAGKGHLVEVTRQELLPPWRQLRETWFLHEHPQYKANPYDGQATREGDGRTCSCVPGYMSLSSCLGEALFGALRVAKARDAETEELAKP